MAYNAEASVANVAFTKRVCGCKYPLFSKKYLRPHRTNGSKVLRCFPHCCPTHTESPFCASSLAVRVTGSVPFLQHCIVLLHFEASYEPPIACGDLLDEPTIESALRTESNPRGEWIPTQVVAIEENHVVYEYNAEAESGWNYRWLGGSSTQQRRCWHCIKAYVLARVECPADQPKLQVIAIVQSPPFVVMSYRRACKSCQKKSTVDPVLSATSREACECEGIYRLSDTHLDEIISKGATRVAILPPVQAIAPGVANKPSPAEIERHLGLLYTALATTTMVVSADAALVQCALELCSGNVESSKDPHFSHHDVHTCIVMALLRGRAASDEFMRQHAHSILDQDDLHRLYEEWLVLLYGRVCAAVTSTHSRAAAYFATLATTSLMPPSASHEAAKTPSKGFEAFVAQLREVFLALEYTGPIIASARKLDGVWRLDLAALRIESTAWTPSVLTVARCLSMAVGCRIVLAAQSLFVRSELALFSTIWSEFVLDGKPRVLRVFPNGESTMTNCADLMYGDYIGSKPPNTNSIRLDLFCWPVEGTRDRSCYAIRLVFHVGGSEHLDGHVDVQVADDIVEQKTWNLTAAERVDLLRRHNLTTVARIAVGYTNASMG